MLEIRRCARRIQYVVSSRGQVLLITHNHDLAKALEEALEKQGYPAGYRLTVWDKDIPT